jgi:hypothetical protein
MLIRSISAGDASSRPAEARRAAPSDTFSWLLRSRVDEGWPMKRLFAFLCLVMSLCLLASSAAAADKVKGTVKQVDEKARTITFAADGATKEEVLPVEKGVDLGAVKANAKAQITIDGGVVKEIKAERARSAPGY